MTKLEELKRTAKKNKKKGTATVVIMGIGNYSGTKKIKFKIV